LEGGNCLKPKINQMFTKITDPILGNLEIENAAISKQNRIIRLFLNQNIGESEKQRLRDMMVKAYSLRDVQIFYAETRNDNVNTSNVEYVKRSQAKKDIKTAENTEKMNFDFNEGELIFGRKFHDPIVPISSINDDTGFVAFRGKVFEFEFKDITSRKTQKEFHILTFSITDMTDSITVQMFIDKTEEDEEYNRLCGVFNKKSIKRGVFLVVKGKAAFNEYSHETAVSAYSLVRINDFFEKRTDNAEKKRVELHMHTQMSAMDAVSSAGSIIDRAVSWGHSAVAITDHGVVQAYPDAMHASNESEKIKVIYGVEGYLVDDSSKITYGITNETSKSSFVVFDIETTGLDKYKEEITEIGAVKIENGEITDKWSTFVNPGKPIPQHITDLTSITDEMVANAPKIQEILPEFLEFCKGSVLVAQNAAFDTGFIKVDCKKMGIEYDFPCVDTLILAKSLYPELPNHKLDTLTKHLKIVLEHHHRAVDDAKATADIFIKMLEEIDEKGYPLNELNEKFDTRSASKKNKAYHIILLAKNQIGLRHIYEMVSDSHLKYFHRTPRIPRSLLEEKREGIIVGSACEAGELFTAVVQGKEWEEIKRISEFYDYLEIQPLGNNEYMKRSDEFSHINTDEDLMNLNRTIIKLGEEVNKPVVATCDVHFLDMDGADYRKILMHYKGFKDADQQAPLYFRTTEEMLEEFKYLGEEKAYEVVVTNTNLISDMIEQVLPIPHEKCPPEIDGAQEGIVNDSMNKAKKIYGDPLPEIVKTRLDKELYSITTYGFSVMYRIAQELVRKSLSDGYLVGSRGSVGSSFVAFLSDITEVNSLPPHYICPNCKNSEFVNDGTGVSGCDLPDKDCPVCGTKYKKDGHDIPFETFLGFKGDKEPDIDLNFSGSYQPRIHKYTEEFFGEGYVFRAGTIGTVAEKTAYGYVLKYEEEKGLHIRNAEKRRLAAGCEGVKRTSGQHPGGIIVVPYKNNIHEFCPIQHPADDPDSDIITTHFDYHSIDQNLLKLDELGHDDPTVIRMLTDLTGIDPQTIPLDDKETLSLFTSTDALHITEDIGSPVGTYGVPEFGTSFVRQMLLDTRPTMFSELVRISGLSHGTDVWLGNAQSLIQAGITTLSNAICTRDDIMIYLIHMGVEAGHAFKIMESVRKGKGLKPEDEEAMIAANVPEWYIDSCKKIKYMFPKAHAVAYVTMAFRIAYCKVHYPEAFYIAYYSVRADDFDASIMARGMKVARQAMADLQEKQKNNVITPKEKGLIPILEICIEMYARGLKFVDVDLYESHATDFLSTPEGIRPPLNALPNLGENAAKSIMEEREKAPFKTREELRIRTGVTKTVMEILEENHCLDKLPEKDQVTLFDLFEE